MKRLSDTHLLSSTRIRCITAICPAGPPKLSVATRNQTRNASPVETPCAGRVRERATPSTMSGPLLVGGPIVRFAGRITAPAIESIVERQARFELFEIVGIHARQAERRSKQAGRFRREIEASRVRSAHDRRKPKQRRRREVKFLNEYVEGAGLAAMTPEHPFDIERSRPELLRDCWDFRRGYEHEQRRRIDEAADEPRAGDAVDFRTLARHPYRAALPVARGQLAYRHERQLASSPSREPVVEHLGRRSRFA